MSYPSERLISGAAPKRGGGCVKWEEFPKVSSSDSTAECDQFCSFPLILLKNRRSAHEHS